eukprot:jgi/Chrzof1/5495/Cz16g05120.t1
MNFGLWHGSTQYHRYKRHLHDLGQYYRRMRSKFPNMIFMETPKQHFDSVDGDYQVEWISKRQGPFNCQPIQGLKFKTDGSLAATTPTKVIQAVVEGTWRNIEAHRILRDIYSMPIMPIYNVTATAYQMHRENSKGRSAVIFVILHYHRFGCTRYCRPSLKRAFNP